LAYEQRREGQGSGQTTRRQGHEGQKVPDALDKLVLDLEENKKKAAAEGKKPGTQAILDALK
jgi:hypothetical protein